MLAWARSCPILSPSGNDGQFHIFKFMSTTALLAARECLPDLGSQSLVGEFDSETGFGSLLDVTDADPGG